MESKLSPAGQCCLARLAAWSAGWNSASEATPNLAMEPCAVLALTRVCLVEHHDRVWVELAAVSRGPGGHTKPKRHV